MITRRLTISAFALLLVACEAQASRPALPTAHVVVEAQSQVVVLPTLMPSPMPTATATLQPPTATPATVETQYRAWMEEARVAHPYEETIEQMWAVMLCESGGQAEISNGINVGLFQFHPDTWAGNWNPYRDQPITDPRAQIFATAKAWQDGYQSWWGCY